MLRDSAAEQAAIFDLKITESFKQLNACAEWLTRLDESDSDRAMEALAALMSNSDFSRLGMVDASGALHDNDGLDIDNISDRAYFAAAIGGERGFEFLEDTYNRLGPAFALAVPIETDGRITGVLVGLLNEPVIRATVVSAAFGGEAYSVIADRDGRIIVGSDHPEYAIDRELWSLESLTEGARTAGIRGMTADKLASALATGTNAYFNMPIDGEAHYMYCLPTAEGIYIVNVVREDVVQTAAMKSAGAAVALMAAITLLAAGLMLTVLFTARRTASRLAAERDYKERSEQEFRIAAAHSDSRIMRYDCAADKLLIDSDTASVYSLPVSISDPTQWFIDNGLVQDVSEADFARMFENMRAGVKHGVMDMGFIGVRTGEPLWIKIEYTTVKVGNDASASAVITVQDVTEERERAAAYELWRQTIESIPSSRRTVMEFDLIPDRLESVSGELFSDIEAMPAETPLNDRARRRADTSVYYEDVNAFVSFANRERLITSFYDGDRDQSLDFRVRKSGELRWLNVEARLIQPNNTAGIKAVLIYTDVTDAKRSEQALVDRSERDSLTGIYNKASFEHHVTNTLAAEHSGRHALFMLDLDHFKDVNDTFGHATGDKIISGASSDLRAMLRPGDIVGRVGGDEFMVLLRNIPYDSTIEKRASAIRDAMHRDLGEGVVCGVSIGIAVYPRDGLTFAELYRAADLAAYRAKDKGRGRYEFYRPEMAGTLRAPIRTPIDTQENDGERQEKLRKLIDDIETQDAILNDRAVIGGVSELVGLFRLRMDARYSLVAANERFCRILGYRDLADLRAHAAAGVDCIQREELERVRRMVDGAAQHPDEYTEFIVNTVLNGDETGRIYVRGRALAGESGTEFVGFMLDADSITK